MDEPNTKLDDFAKRCRRGRRRARRGANEVSCWTEEEILDGKKVQAFCMIIRTRGCSHDRCTMCGYNDVSDPAMDPHGILEQFSSVMSRLQDQKIVKLFNSGSFFNDDEVPPEARDAILSALNGKTTKLIVETRAEYADSEKLENAKKAFPGIEVAIGLESANDTVLKYCVNKGMAFADYEKAAKTVKSSGIPLKTYLLLKPPFLTEAEAIRDSLDSIQAAAKYSDEISLNPANVQNNTVVEFLWRRNAYRPPWLWSVARALGEGKNLLPEKVRLMSSPTGGGTPRGAHNCGKCDSAIIAEIREFSSSQDPSVFKADCTCREEWLDLLELEPFAHTSANLKRILERSDR
jgi:hypothetical protein